MKKLFFIAIFSIAVFIPQEAVGQVSFEGSYQQAFFKDASWVPLHDQTVELSGKYLLSTKDCQEISLEGYVRDVTAQGGKPSVGILSFDFMPNQNVGIKIGGGINFSPEGNHTRGRMELFIQSNEIYYIDLVGEAGGATGYYWNGELILKATSYFNVGFMADRNWLRTGDPEDGYGPRVEINATGTPPLLFFGGAIFPWGDSGGIEKKTPGGYAGISIFLN
jgi:hypothetical protein